MKKYFVLLSADYELDCLLLSGLQKEEAQIDALMIEGFPKKNHEVYKDRINGEFSVHSLDIYYMAELFENICGNEEAYGKLEDSPHFLFTVASIAVARAEALKIRHIVFPFTIRDIEKVTDHPKSYLALFKKIAEIGTSEEYIPEISFPLLKEIEKDKEINQKTGKDGGGEKNDKVLLLYSGGLDCTVAAYALQRKYKKLYMLNMQYGQSGRYQEGYCRDENVKALRKNGEVENIVVGISIMTRIGGTALLDDGRMIGESNMAEEYVPFRNTIFLNIALMYARYFKINTISTGTHKDDVHAPDCQMDYYEVFQQLIGLERGLSQIKLYPILFEIGGKRELIKEGFRLGVDFRKTWSCHNYVPESCCGPNAKACGICGNCKSRYRAFRQAGSTDPVRYEVVPDMENSQ